jgi:AcrR family transcriptional regulator
VSGPKRLRPEVRREQIVEATLELVAQHGVRGATVARIADRVGVTTPALYAHFANRREVLLTALAAVFKRIRAIHEVAAEEANALERLRLIAHLHSRLVLSQSDGFVSVLFEFIAASPAEGLRDALGEGNLVLVDDLAEIVRLGQQQGTIVPEADPEQIAWLIVSRSWTEDVSRLMGLSGHWNEERSNEMLAIILDSIAMPFSA